MWRGMDALKSALVPVALVGMLCGGCPSGGDGGGDGGVGLPFADEVFSIETTSAVVGGTGLVRVSVGDPVLEDTAINLQSSNPSILTIPTTLEIPAGSTTGQAAFSGIAEGSATITASIGTSQRQTVAEVVDALRLNFVDGPEVIEVGASSTLYVSLNTTVPTDTNVTITSSNPAVLATPASLTVQEFYSSAEVAVRALAAGNTTITARLGDVTRSNVVSVVEDPTLTSLSLNDTRLEVGAVTNLSVDLNAIVAADTAVTLTSSNPAVLEVPATLTVPAGDSDVDFGVTAAAAGTTTITATLGASTRSVVVTVVNDPVLTTFYLSDDRVLLGPPQTVYVGFDAVVAEDTLVTLTSSNPAVATVPAQVLVLAGENFSSTASISVLAAGQTTLSASFGGVTLERSLNVVTQPSISSLDIESKVAVGDSFILYVYLDVEAATDVVVNLTSSNPAAIAVPATVIVPAGSTSSYPVFVEGLAAGQASITATLGSSSRTEVITVVTAPTLTNFSTTSRMQTGLVTNFSLSTDTEAATDTTITIISSDPSVLAVPGTVTLEAGRTFVSFNVTAGTPGVATLTAQLGGSTQIASVTVVAIPSITSFSSSSTLQIGATGSASLSLDAAVAADTLVTFTNPSPGIVSIQSSVLINKGSSSVSVTVTAVGDGFANITADLLGQSVGTTVNTTAVAGVSNVFASPVPVVGGIGRLQVSLDAVVATDTVVTLTQTNAAALGLPTTLTVPANRSTGTVQITGLANLMTTVTATLGATSDNVNIQPPLP